MNVSNFHALVQLWKAYNYLNDGVWANARLILIKAIFFESALDFCSEVNWMCAQISCIANYYHYFFDIICAERLKLQ